MKYAVVSFGCRVNQADSLAIEDALRARGAAEVAPEAADLVIVNTCSVTASADQAARQAVRRIVGRNRDVQVVVTGCYATRAPGEIVGLPNVVRVVGNNEKDRLIASISSEAGLSTTDRHGHGDGPCGATLVPGVMGRTALTLGVQTGCDEACSYCIIPQTRGASRSRPLVAVLADIERATAAGYKEIVITGVHLGSYGRDLGDETSLLSLVRALVKRPEDVLFRISSLEPMDCPEALVDLVAGSPRLAPHFHLPLQHGSDTMLRTMCRPYSAGYYRSLVERIRTRLPNAAIGSDVIVGFPGETGAQFSEMTALLEDLPLTHLHVFPYSDRPGTAASRLERRVDGRLVRERGQQVRAIGERLSARFRASQIGREMRALTVDDGRSVVTGNYLKLRLDTSRARNEWMQVRVLDVIRAEAT